RAWGGVAGPGRPESRVVAAVGVRPGDREYERPARGGPLLFCDGADPLRLLALHDAVDRDLARALEADDRLPGTGAVHRVGRGRHQQLVQQALELEDVGTGHPGPHDPGGIVGLDDL